MLIDCHTHVLDTGFFPNEWFDWVSLQWASRKQSRDPSSIRAKIEDGLIDPTGEQMIAAMDSAGVDRAVILPIDWGPAFVDRVPMERLNEHATMLSRRHAGRFTAFVGVDPRRPFAADLVEQAFRDGSAHGLKLYPPAGFDPFDSRLFPIYEICVQYGYPVLFHTGEPLPKMSLRYRNPILLQDVHASFPGLISFIGHAGAKLWWSEALSVAANSINSYLELSAWIWDDTSEESQLAFVRQLAEARHRLGIERLIFGSDHLSGRRVRGEKFLVRVVDWYRNLPRLAAKVGLQFTQREVDSIMGGNAARLLGLGP